jgi:hypothetical protein
VQIVRESLQRQRVLAAEASLEPQDPAASREEEDGEELDIQFVAADFMGAAVLRCFGEDAARCDAFVNKLLPDFFHLCEGEGERRKLGVYMLDDVLEHVACRGLFQKRVEEDFVEKLLPVLVLGLRGAADHEIAQACAHGIDVAARAGRIEGGAGGEVGAAVGRVLMEFLDFAEGKDGFEESRRSAESAMKALEVGYI